MTDQLPFQAQQPIFDKVGGISELSHMSQEERRRYFKSLNKYRTNLSVMINEREEGREEGLREGRTQEKLANARSMKALGVATDIIAQVTGLTAEEIAGL